MKNVKIKSLDLNNYRCFSGERDFHADFGEKTREKENEWLRCDIRIATAAFSEWQLADAGKMMEIGDELGRDWICLAAFGSEEARREAQRRLGISVIRIPLLLLRYRARPGTTFPPPR